jgi:hypothetical protein
MTKKRLIEREKQFAWIYRKDFPDWGRGRDDSMNLTKYFMLELPMDDSFGPDDIPPIWNLKKYNALGTTMNHAGDSHDAYSVIIDSALGVLAPRRKTTMSSRPHHGCRTTCRACPTEIPFPDRCGAPKPARPCSNSTARSRHASGGKTGRRMPLAGIDTTGSASAPGTRSTRLRPTRS